MGKFGMREREFSSSFIEMQNREIGSIDPRLFSNRAATSLDIILRLGLDKKLAKHRNCVNTVSFNSNGNILVSGSNDRMVKLWDWEMGLLKFSFHSGHVNSVFQAMFIPHKNDRKLVTCGADGNVQVIDINEGGRVLTSSLVRHEDRARKIAVEPDTPYKLYSCGEDGFIYHIDLRVEYAVNLIKCKSLKNKKNYMSIMQLYALAIDPRNPNCVAVAGSEEFVRVYDIRRCQFDAKEYHNPLDYFCPSHLIGANQISVSGLAYSEQSELLASYNNEAIYMFSKDQGLGSDLDSTIHMYTKDQRVGDSLVQVYIGRSNFCIGKGVNFFGPNCEYVTSGSDCGRLFIWRKKGGELLRVMEGDKQIVNCVESNPCTTMLASCGIENDIKIWLPNAEELAAPVDVEQVMKKDPIKLFSDIVFDVDDDRDDDDDHNHNNDDLDHDYDNHHDDDDDDRDVDEDGDSMDFLYIDSNDETEDNENDDDDDDGYVAHNFLNGDNGYEDDDYDNDGSIVTLLNDGVESIYTVRKNDSFKIFSCLDNNHNADYSKDNYYYENYDYDDNDGDRDPTDFFDIDAFMDNEFNDIEFKDYSGDGENDDDDDDDDNDNDGDDVEMTEYDSA